MKLSYRGASYEYNPPTLEVTEGEVMGRYRGAAWRCHTVKEMPYAQPRLDLSYRGVPYTTGDVARDRAPRRVGAAGLSMVSAQVPTALPVLREVSRIHRANLQRNLQHRLEVAKAQGNTYLIDLLEAESRQLAL